MTDDGHEIEVEVIHDIKDIEENLESKFYMI